MNGSQTGSRFAARIAGEIVIVVIGILIAFALDAAWERRSTRAQEQAHLHALASDFSENVSRLQRHIEQERRISMLSLEVLRMAQRPGGPPNDSIARLLGGVFNSGRYEPVLGAYEALVNSGDFTIIRDDSLRAALADFGARVNAHYAEQFSDQLYFSMIREFAGQIGFASSAATGNFDPARNAALFRNPKFHEYLALRHLSERDVARRYEELQTLARWIHTRITAAIQR